MGNIVLCHSKKWGCVIMNDIRILMHTMSRVDKKRTSLIERLLKANDDFPLLAKELSRYEWDFGGIPVLLEKEHVEDILERYVEGKIDADFLHEWAEFIELRDDIDYPEEDIEVERQKLLDMIRKKTRRCYWKLSTRLPLRM